jgi:hypothetical protein
VVGERRLRDVEPEGAAAERVRLVRQALDDPQPVRIAERVKHGRKLQLVT